MLEIKRALVPIDFSDDARRALELALQLVDGSESEVVLLHVVESQVYASDLSLTAPPVPVETQVAERASKALDRLAAEAVPEGTRWSRRVEIGRPASKIVEVAEDLGADLIVIGTMGLTGVRHLLLGSTAERVVRTASCPVLTVRRPTKD